MELNDLNHKFYHGIRGNELNKNFDIFLLESIFRSGKIVCKRLNPFYYGFSTTNFAGNSYVCLAQKKNAFDFDYNAVIENIIENLKDKDKLREIRSDLEVNVLPCINERDAYFKFIERNLSLVINPTGQEIKTVLTNIDPSQLNLDGPIRYTNLTSEYHVKGFIDLDNVIAVGYPLYVLESLNHIRFLLYDMDDYIYYENQIKIQDKVEQIHKLIRQYGLQLPMVDLHQKRLIL